MLFGIVKEVTRKILLSFSSTVRMVSLSVALQATTKRPISAL